MRNLHWGSRSAISRRSLGTALLVRHSRGVKPTEAGAILFQHASKILEDVRRAKEAVLTVSNQPKGTVTVGMTPGISDLLAAKLVKSCNRDCPAIRLNIEQDLSVRLVRRISSDDRLAFALVSGMECDASQRADNALGAKCTATPLSCPVLQTRRLSRRKTVIKLARS